MKRWEEAVFFLEFENKCQYMTLKRGFSLAVISQQFIIIKIIQIDNTSFNDY